MSTTVNVPITLPQGFEYVVAALVSITWVLLMQYRLVILNRLKAGIAYPQLYADKAQQEASKDAFTFNCAQRAHQNTLEMLPLIYTVTIVTGLRYPIPASIACGIWAVSRVAYTFGYISGNPDRRNNVITATAGLAMISQLIFSSYLAVSWVLGGLKKLL